MNIDIRRVIPRALLAVMSVMALAAALLGLLNGPSLTSINLQIAEARTAAAPSFSFQLTDARPDFIGSTKTIGSDLRGTWQSPDRVKVTTVPGHGRPESTEIAVGSTIHSARFSGIRFPKSLATSFTDPFNTSQIPELGLPPLGLVTMAQHVVHKGDTYTFVIPSTRLRFGWVAYAPLSGGAQAFTVDSGPVAHDTRMVAVVQHGVIVSLSFPEGVHGGRIRLGGPEVWTLSHLGTAPEIHGPS